MINDKQWEAANNAIAEADSIQLAGLLHSGLRALGGHGREAAERLLEIAQDPDFQDERDLLNEGLVQIAAVEGVLSGRTDAL